MSEEWGPWIEHDGKGCPCVGEFVHCIHLNDCGFTREVFSIAGATRGRSWDWSNAPQFTRIIRYRIRRPRGMAILEGLLENLPATVEGVDA